MRATEPFAERRRIVWKILGNAVGWISIFIGLVGVFYHLNSSFFEERTLKSLTYSAPFAAPLAYTGLGFLLVLNRMVDANSMEWPKWVLFGSFSWRWAVTQAILFSV